MEILLVLYNKENLNNLQCNIKESGIGFNERNLKKLRNLNQKSRFYRGQKWTVLQNFDMQKSKKKIFFKQASIVCNH